MLLLLGLGVAVAGVVSVGVHLVRLGRWGLVGGVLAGGRVGVGGLAVVGGRGGRGRDGGGGTEGALTGFWLLAAAV